MEAAQAWHLSPSEWRMHSPDDRAKMLAHELIKGIRESYRYEQMKAAGKKDKGHGRTGADDLADVKRLLSRKSPVPDKP